MTLVLGIKASKSPRLVTVTKREKAKAEVLSCVAVRAVVRVVVRVFVVAVLVAEWGEQFQKRLSVVGKTMCKQHPLNSWHPHSSQCFPFRTQISLPPLTFIIPLKKNLVPDLVPDLVQLRTTNIPTLPALVPAHARPLVCALLVRVLILVTPITLALTFIAIVLPLAPAHAVPAHVALVPVLILPLDLTAVTTANVIDFNLLWLIMIDCG